MHVYDQERPDSSLNRSSQSGKSLGKGCLVHCLSASPSSMALAFLHLGLQIRWPFGDGLPVVPSRTRPRQVKGSSKAGRGDRIPRRGTDVRPKQHVDAVGEQGRQHQQRKRGVPAGLGSMWSW